MVTISDVPEYSGYNTRKCRENGQTVLYTPLINRKPADPTTMLSAMLEAQKFTSEADQQLYKVMIDIVWVYPELFIYFVSRYIYIYKALIDIVWVYPELFIYFVSRYIYIYKVLIDIVWVYPELFIYFVSRYIYIYIYIYAKY